MSNAKARRAEQRAAQIRQPATATDQEPVSVRPSPSPFALAVERRGLMVAFAIYLVWQVSAALHHGAMGQDFGYHVGLIQQALRDPWAFATVATGWRTNPPLYHLLASRVVACCRGIHAVEVLALFNAGINVLGLLLFARILRRLIADPILRFACMVLVLFLPFAMIHAVVLASDSPATAVFLLLVYLYMRLAEQTRPWRIVAFGAFAGIVLLAGLGTKFTFASVAALAPILVALLAWTNRWKRGTVLLTFLLAAAIPLGTAIVEMRAYRGAMRSSHFAKSEGPTGAFSLRSILFFRSEDGYLLNAPPYNETITADARHSRLPATGDGIPANGTTFSIIIPNRFSYPALLHLGMFTDLLNIYQYDPADKFFGPRSAANQTRMRTAVRTGLPFSMGLLCAVPFVVFSALRAVVRRRSAEAVRPLIPTLPALAFHLNILAVLPFATFAYPGGYWLPRLLVPVLLIYFACIFVALDRLPARARNIVRWIALACVVLQSGLHLSFLWPWGA
jgi:hypothetical protein